MKMQTAAVAATLATVLLAAETAAAKRDFFVQNEVRCEDNGAMCFEAATDRPLTGELRFYYPEGATKIKATYANGRRQGKYRAYYPDGELRYAAEYRDGKIAGVATRYYNNGKISEETSYDNGARDGVRRFYYRDGTLRQEEEYAAGKRQGFLKRYYPDGSPAVRVTYADGAAISGYCLTPKGQRIDFSANIKDFNEDGKTPCDEMLRQAAENYVYDN